MLVSLESGVHVGKIPPALVNRLEKLLHAYHVRPCMRGRPRPLGARFEVAGAVRRLAFAELPVSPHVVAALAAAGHATLGDIDEYEEREFSRYVSLGRSGLNELRELVRRANAGDFNLPPADRKTAPRELAHSLDRALMALTPVQQKFLSARIGGQGTAPQSTGQIARDVGISRSGADVTVRHALRNVVRSAGPRIPYLLAQVNERVRAHGADFDAEVFESWLSGESTKMGAAAYVCLIALLNRLIARAAAKSRRGILRSDVWCHICRQDLRRRSSKTLRCAKTSS